MKIAVIGGGPAGMMAAISAAQNGADVTLFEKNEKLGKKLYISGKGRCNITNNCTEQEFLSNVVTNSKFLFGAIRRFSPSDTVSFCESRGLKTKTERGNRVFPLSDKSSDVIKTFSNELQHLGIETRLNCEILALEYQQNAFSLTTITDIIKFDNVILATGGVSYSATGSTGDGYRFARALGHSVTLLHPSLCRIIASGTSGLEGLSLKNVTVGIADSNGNIFDSEFGEMLFTKDGVSGPAVLTLSSRINRLGSYKHLNIVIDLKPALDRDKLDSRILRDFATRMNKNFINSLSDLLPERLTKLIVERSGIPFDKKVNQITVNERTNLVGVIKALKFPFVKLDDIEFGIVTSGGVDVSEINPSTMESKLVKGLYFAGELIDVDAYTGGYNIQIALSTGYVAGTSASRS